MTTTLHKNQCSIHTYADRTDPTRTLTLRNAFAREMGRRFRELRGVVREAIVEQDCFGLKEPSPFSGRIIILARMVAPGYRAFAFSRSQDKITAFMEWFNKQVDVGILEVTERQQLGTAIESAWTNKYVKQSYERGVERGRREIIKAGYQVPTIEATGGLAAAFSTATHLDRVGILYARTFSDLKGITNAMDTQISRILAQGIAEGRGPIDLARQLTRTISGPVGDLGLTDTLGRFIPAERRAKILARTEIIRAHHEAMIQEYENWKVAGVIVKAEWVTAGDDRVCPDCADLEGQVFTLEEVRGMIPLHPMCRCITIPVDVTDKEKS